MLMSINDERFIQPGVGSMSEIINEDGAVLVLPKDNASRTCTRTEMLRYLNRVLDRNKPLFLFNSKMNSHELAATTSTPSFSMIALIEKKEF